MASSKRVRQAGRLLSASVITAIGLAALVTADSVFGRVFDLFVLAVGLAAVCLVIIRR